MLADGQSQFQRRQRTTITWRKTVGRGKGSVGVERA